MNQLGKNWQKLQAREKETDAVIGELPFRSESVVFGVNAFAQRARPGISLLRALEESGEVARAF
jgi:hypothetical protein